MPNTVRKFKTPSAFWLGMARLGLSPAAVLGHARLPMTLYDGDRNLVTTAEYFAIWRALEELSAVSTVGVELVRALDARVLPPANLAALCARTFRDGLVCMARFKRLCTREEMDLRESRDEVAIEFRWHEDEEYPPPALTDACFASVVELGRAGTEKDVRPLRVELRRASPVAALDDYYRAPVKYGARRSVLVLARGDVDAPFISHNRDLFELLQPGLEQARVATESPGVSIERVKWVLKRLISGSRPDVSVVARELGVSERTLQRRIMESGTSFRSLTQEARRELARAYLVNDAVELAEVAFLLGYNDANSFLRAFRSWEGVTPTQWRERQRGKARGRGGVGA